MPTFKRLPVVLARGHGVRVWDTAGKEYLDFVGGWAASVLGHDHPALVNALETQAHTLIQVSNQFYTIPQLQLAELLVQHSCLQKVFFCNSGAEANEGAVKLARKYGRLHLRGAYEVITALNSFHGRTLAMIAATGQRKFQEPFLPLPEGFTSVEYDNVEAIQAATSDRTCAVMLEPVQGESGVNIPQADYFQKVRQWCDEKGLLLILDEVQTGAGRTGTLFAYEQLGIEPDVVTLAKGLGGGVPIGAILAKEKASVFSPGDHGSTFGGNPLACAAGYATLSFILANGILENVRRVGTQFMSGLDRLRTEFDFICDLRGTGLLVALEFHRDISSALVQTCMQMGLLVNSVKANAIRFMPPLIIQADEIDQAIGILQRALVHTATVG